MGNDPDRRMARVAFTWTLTLVLAGALVGGACWYRQTKTTDESVQHLPRTRALVVQKINSLQNYNDEITRAELLRFYQAHLRDRPILDEAFEVMTDLVVDQLLPTLWKESQKQANGRLISHTAIVETIHKTFPQTLLVNGNVILFPDDRDLRMVVSEPPQDFFRDTGWHWRWIDMYLSRLTPKETWRHKELDIYAGEELSEFLSVFGVALIKLADRLHDDKGSPIDSDSVRMAFAWATGPHRSLEAAGPNAEVGYSHGTKLRVIASLPKPMFREVASQMGIDFRHRPNEELRRRRRELVMPVGMGGGGVAAEDFDGDGDIDLYFAGDEAGRLYQNIDGQFQDVTSAAGLDQQGESRAGYFIDYDNDGDQDLFITFVYRTNRLYRNEGNGRFADVTDESGLNSGKDISHGAIWFDMDNDGLLDLYVANHGNWVEGATATLGSYCVNGGPNRLYRHRIQDGKHMFEEVAEKFGVDDRGWTHCVGAWDYNSDGYPDLCSVNDFGSSRIFRNTEGKRFDDVSRELRLDAIYNAMNFTLLDIDHSGEPAIYVSEIMKLVHRQRYRKPTEHTPIVFSEENMNNLRALVNNRLYLKRQEGGYRDIHNDIIEPADLGWAWDASALDYENDSDLDLLVLNGTDGDIPKLENNQHMASFRQREFMSQFAHERNVFFISQNGYFYDLSDYCEMAYEGNSRGSTFFDFDSDGDIDVAINDYFGPAKMFENLQNSTNNWIRFKLVGTRSNRDAIGAKVQVQFGDQMRGDQIVSGSGFLSQNPRTLHFGLAEYRKADVVTITWPSGETQVLTEDFVANKVHEIVQPPSDKVRAD